MDNVSWLEYLYWTSKVFGKDSKEYAEILPDSLVWIRDGLYIYPFVSYYMRHPAHQQYPVVGITQEQAKQFSKWRSDRVFESMLTKLHKIKPNTTPNKDTYFTIEKYFTDSYQGTLPGKKVMYFPSFRLPTVSERQKILNFAESVENVSNTKPNSRRNKNCALTTPLIYCDVTLQKDTFIDPVRNVNSHCPSQNTKPIYNLRGNVSEWLNEKDVAVGGGWIDSKERILKTDTFVFITPNAWTGFRNVCEWKKWSQQAN